MDGRLRERSRAAPAEVPAQLSAADARSAPPLAGAALPPPGCHQPTRQLIAGCVARAYNRRKRRRGALWEDCYHATAVVTDAHLARCFTYIDLNMVRAGVVDHPRHWLEGGYHEIQHPPRRYRVIDRDALCALLSVTDDKLAALQNDWIEAALAKGRTERESHWSEVLAVGRRSFVKCIQCEGAVQAHPRGGRQRGATRSGATIRCSFKRRNGRPKLQTLPKSLHVLNQFGHLGWSDHDSDRLWSDHDSVGLTPMTGEREHQSGKERLMAVRESVRDRLDATETGFLVIADISGYTGFLAHNELAHAQGILAEITQLLIDKLSAPFRFVELEGDAVFVFAPSVAVEDSERLVDIMEACYAAFRIRLEQMVANTTCECAACRTIPDLDLKFVAHFGRYIPQKTPNGTQLVGPDVILVHRLLKNAVIEKTGIKGYALLTNTFISKAAFEQLGVGLPHHVEDIPELGVIEGRVLDLAASIDRYRESARRYIGPGEAGLEIATDLPAARSLAWAYFVDAKRRLQWQQDTKSIKNHPSANGRSGVGWESHCDHGSYRMNHRITDWKPFDYISMETSAQGNSIRKPPDCDITFEFRELEGNHCRLVMRVSAKNPSAWIRLMLSLARPIIKREWREHFDALKQLLREDVARADAASMPANC